MTRVSTLQGLHVLGAVDGGGLVGLVDGGGLVGLVAECVTLLYTLR